MISDFMSYIHGVYAHLSSFLKEEWKPTVTEPFLDCTPASLLTLSSYTTFTLCQQTQTQSEKLLSDSEHKKT